MRFQEDHSVLKNSCVPFLTPVSGAEKNPVSQRYFGPVAGLLLPMKSGCEFQNTQGPELRFRALLIGKDAELEAVAHASTVLVQKAPAL